MYIFTAKGKVAVSTYLISIMKRQLHSWINLSRRRNKLEATINRQKKVQAGSREQMK